MRMEELQEQCIDALEYSALKRATDGWLEPVFQRGMFVGYRRCYSQGLTIFMLKANRPDKYPLDKQLTSDFEDQAKKLRDFLQAAGGTVVDVDGLPGNHYTPIQEAKIQTLAQEVWTLYRLLTIAETTVAISDDPDVVSQSAEIFEGLCDRGRKMDEDLADVTALLGERAERVREDTTLSGKLHILKKGMRG